MIKEARAILGGIRVSKLGGDCSVIRHHETHLE